MPELARAAGRTTPGRGRDRRGEGREVSRATSRKACTVSARRPGREQVRSRGDRGGLFSSRGRGGGICHFLPGTFPPPSSSAFGIGRRPMDRDLFLSGSPVLGEGGGRSGQRFARWLAAAPSPGSAPLLVAPLAPAPGCAHPAAQRTNPAGGNYVLKMNTESVCQ